MTVTWPELERALCRIPHVTRAHVVSDAADTVRELHIVATPGKPAKQLVRDVQSVAMAGFGVAVDHQVVSVVQLEDDEGDEPIRAVSTSRGRLPGPPGRMLLIGMTLHSRQGHSAVSVILRLDGREVTGTAARPATAVGLHRLTAEATIDALAQLEPGGRSRDIDGVELCRVGGRQIALVVVAQRAGGADDVLVGAAGVRAAGELDAVARAVLDAVNRRGEPSSPTSGHQAAS